MTESERMVLTAALTIVGGIIVFVMGQGVVRFGIDPFQAFRELTGELTHLLLSCATILSSSEAGTESERKEVARALNDKAAQLLARVNSTPFYAVLSAIGLVPKWSNVGLAYRRLIDLRDEVQGKHSEKSKALQNDIFRALHLKIVE